MAEKKTARKRGRTKRAAAEASAKKSAKAGAASSSAKGAAKRSTRGGAKGSRKAAAPAAKRRRRKSTKAAAKRGGRKPAPRRRAKAAAASGEELLTLTEVSRRTGISMPTLQRYKKEYQNRLQTVGEGRTQRYKVGSLETFQQIKKENLKKRGRPRKAKAAKAAPAKRRKAASTGTPEGLISLSEIGRRTGISYPTLLRYVRLHGDRIPSHGSGRRRRFPVEAVPIFSQLRKESRRGRRKGSTAKKAAGGSGLEGRLRRLEKSHAALDKQIRKLVRALSRPLLR